MIAGIGSDIIEIERIKKAISRYRERFLNRIFTLNEQFYCLNQNKKEPAIHFAGRFAAKEAIAKSLGTGFHDELTWLDIEICNDSYGKPNVLLSPRLKPLYISQTFHISISHCREYATAYAIRESL